MEGVQHLGDKAVTCHRLNFQKATFSCHKIKATTTYMVSLKASDDGTKTQALVVCHADNLVKNHQLLRGIMKVDPGTNRICHFLGNKAILWVPNQVMDNNV